MNTSQLLEAAQDVERRQRALFDSERFRGDATMRIKIRHGAMDMIEGIEAVAIVVKVDETISETNARVLMDRLHCIWKTILGWEV